MPNRIVRDGILRSESVCSMSPLAQLFYRCLHSVADDFGRYYARPSLLLSDCFPLRPEWASEEKLAEWIVECDRAGLIKTYSVNGTNYLEISKFNQRVRAGQNSKFPPPAESSGIQPIYAADFRQARESSARATPPPPNTNTPPNTPPTLALAAREEHPPDAYLAEFTLAIGNLGFQNPDANVQTAYFTSKISEVCEQAGADPKLGAMIAADLIKSPRFRGKPMEYLMGALRGELAPGGPNQKALRKASFGVIIP